jgi:Flp pilus assembly protein TadG
VLVLPVLLTVVLAMVQVGVIVHAQIGVTHTAREVVRVLSVDPTADPAAAAAGASPLRAEGLSVDVEFITSGTRRVVVVEVDYSVPPVSRVLSAFGETTVSARAAMVVE